MTAKKIYKIIRKQESHWVGNGFPVHTLISYARNKGISPFLLLDYAGPAYFEPADNPRGVEQHPHRGFETVTIVYEGEVEHRDTAGNSGKIGPGEVQWMTAARGILHEEKHSMAFTKQGGMLEMVQLWVNLPAKDKMSAPHYQSILNAEIPIVETPGSKVRVIAGSFSDVTGAAKTFSPVHLYDISIQADNTLSVPVKNGYNAMLLVRSGILQIDSEQIKSSELVQFDLVGDSITLKAEADTKFLLMAGEPINEPVVGSGPFVMNTEAEIQQAFTDFRSGKF